MSSDLIVVGSCNLDLQLTIDHIPQPGETQSARSYTRAPGGKGANQAAAAARLGAYVQMLGAVGPDDAGLLLLQSLQSFGVSTSLMLRLHEPTGIAAILLTEDGQNSIVVAPGANHGLTPQHIRAQAQRLGTAAVVLTQLETRLDVLAELCTLAMPLMLDPAPAAALPAAVLARVNWFTPNAHEAAFYLQESAAAVEHAPESAARRLQQLGPRNILLKLGAQGAGVCTNEGVWHFARAPQVQAVDTTGAGDVMNAAFAVALTRGDSVAAALRYAVAAATLSVTRHGAMDSAPAPEDVAALLALHPPG